MGQFDIGSEIGKGSFAQVYLGWHKVRLPIPPHHGDGGISTRCDVTGDPNRHQLPPARVRATAAHELLSPCPRSCPADG